MSAFLHYLPAGCYCKILDCSARCVSSSCLTCLSHSLNLQNDFKELWALLKWTVPDDFAELREFEEFYTMPVKMAQQKNASDHHLGKVRSQHLHMHAACRPHFIIKFLDMIVVMGWLANSLCNHAPAQQHHLLYSMAESTNASVSLIDHGRLDW